MTSSWVARPCMMRAQWPTQLFGLCRFEGVTTLAVPRSQRTSAPSVCHAQVGDALYH